MLRGIKWLLEYIISVLKVVFVFSCALFVPRLFVHYVSQASPAQVPQALQETSSFKLGLENITPAMVSTLSTFRIGLVTNHTGKDQLGNRNIDILVKKKFNITAIFTPKHGYYANKAEHAQDEQTIDAPSHIPIISWLDTQQRIEALNAVDILMFDIQDSGMRHGYITTLLEVMRVAGDLDKKVIVLDRPNLLGSYMEGSLFQIGEKGSAASLPIPIRHGMTIGELANYFNKHVLKKSIALEVVPMENYTRHACLPASMHCNLSPNLTTANSCYGYSFLGLLGEVAPFDIGIGTDKAFQCIMLPEHLGLLKQQWYELRTVLKQFGIDSKYQRCFNERKQQCYHGLKLHIKDINTISSCTVLLTVLNFFKDSHVQLSFSDRFDTAIGTRTVRAFFEGDVERKELEAALNKELTNFFAKAMTSFIYKPLPQVVRV